jgi:hypothetical protein
LLGGGLATQAQFPRFFASLFAAGGVFPRFPDLINQYLNRRKDLDCEQFFLAIEVKANIKKGKWYKNIRMGKNTLNSLVKNVTVGAGLITVDGKSFSNHSVRAGVTTSLAKAGVQDSDIVNITRHRSTSSLKSYKGNGQRALKNVTNLMIPKKQMVSNGPKKSMVSNVPKNSMVSKVQKKSMVSKVPKNPNLITSSDDIELMI